MKELLLCIILIFSLTACKQSDEQLLSKLGYSEEEIALIVNLTEENKARFLEEYDEKLLKYLVASDFKETNLDEYLKYDGEFEVDFIIDKVNEGILNQNNKDKLKELYSSKFFIKDKEDLYLKYLNDYKTVRDTIEIVNTKRYLDLYSDIKPVDMSKDYLILVNKYYQLASDYEPDDLVAVTGVPGRGYLRQKVFEAYQQLYEEACKLGYENLTVVSAYRPYSMQESLYNSYKASDPENVDTYSARAGHSEHQSGLCLDVSMPGYSLDDFYLTDASTWLKNHAHEFGFIIRYPEDKTDITGYQGEPWQIRYVGKDVSKEVYELGITYDEYYACFVE